MPVSDSQQWPTDEAIGPFRGEYKFLSNFSSHPIHYNGNVWPTTEHAYQACKAQDQKLYEKILDANSPKEAKRLGYEADLPGNWADIKDTHMAEIVTAKFSQYGHLRQRLLETAGRPIVELNDWGDQYWGADMTGTGHNKLGRILMGVRDMYSRINDSTQ